MASPRAAASPQPTAHSRQTRPTRPLLPRRPHSPFSLAASSSWSRASPLPPRMAASHRAPNHRVAPPYSTEMGGEHDFDMWRILLVLIGILCVLMLPRHPITCQPLDLHQTIDWPSIRTTPTHIMSPHSSSSSTPAPPTTDQVPLPSKACAFVTDMWARRTLGSPVSDKGMVHLKVEDRLSLPCFPSPATASPPCPKAHGAHLFLSRDAPPHQLKGLRLQET
uniref:Uncharacterized protein n=1 Tax=Oryza nivara TaxID=4536 RepID=A0A0E0IJB7_ORYNI